VKKRYTAVLLYPDCATDDFGADVSVQWATVPKRRTLADEHVEAAAAARKQCIERQESGEFGDPPGSDLKLIALFPGHVRCVADATHEL
jgi:hypothetical protein